MTEEIQELIDSLRRGQYQDPSEQINALSAALQEHDAVLDLLLSLIRSPHIPLRLAAMAASQDRKERELLDELLQLESHAESRVRTKLAEILRIPTDDRVVPTLTKLCGDADVDVRIAALRSTAGRPEFRAIQETMLAEDT